MKVIFVYKTPEKVRWLIQTVFRFVNETSGFLPAVSVVPEPGVLSQNMIFSELPNQSVFTASSQLKIENWT